MENIYIIVDVDTGAVYKSTNKDEISNAVSSDWYAVINCATGKQVTETAEETWEETDLEEFEY